MYVLRIQYTPVFSVFRMRNVPLPLPAAAWHTESCLEVGEIAAAELVSSSCDGCCWPMGLKLDTAVWRMTEPRGMQSTWLPKQSLPLPSSCLFYLSILSLSQSVSLCPSLCGCDSLCLSRNFKKTHNPLKKKAAL